MSNTRKPREEHQAILAAIRSRQMAKKRRFNILLYGGFGLVVAAIITAVALAVTGSVQDRNAPAEGARKPIDGIQTFTGLSRNHVQDAVAYPQEPGVGGDHSPVWTNCGIYTEPVNEQRAVHSLEHGAVWITYKPGLAQAEITTLSGLVNGQDHTVMSPFPNLSSPISLQSWGYQLKVDSATDPRIQKFIDALRNNPKTTPEYPASCTNTSFKSHPSTFGKPLDAAAP